MAAPLVGVGPEPDEYVLTVPGKAVPWQAAVKMGKAHNAPRKMPDRQARYAGEIREVAERALGGRLWLEKGRAVEISCLFYINRPKTTQYRSGRYERELKPGAELLRPTGTPDLSNLVKMVEDALTGTLWADDDQVVGIGARKAYIHWWEPPRSIIRLVVLP